MNRLDKDELTGLQVVEKLTDITQSYYKINDQDLKIDTPVLFGETWELNEEEVAFQKSIKVGDLVDALKICNKTGLICWSRAKVMEITDVGFKVQFMNSDVESDRVIEKGTFDIAE